MNPSDIYKAYSGMIDVNSLCKYLRNLHIDNFQGAMKPKGTVFPCIDQKALLMSDSNQQLPDWVTGLEEGVLRAPIALQLLPIPAKAYDLDH
jgi:hypothetical protein